MSDVLAVRDEGSVRVLTMNRPEKLNALNYDLTSALVNALVAADADSEVRAVVLTGEGRSFCAGADTSEFKTLTPQNADSVNERARLTGRLHAIIPQMGTPVIGAVNGFAMGGGAGLALACDYVVADENAVLAYPEVKHGIVAAIVMASLVKHVGRKAAFGLIATGRKVDAREALMLGLVSECAAAGTAVERSFDLAREIAGFSPTAVSASKKLLHAVADISLTDGIALGEKENARMRSYREQLA
ncbi:enoyl-CoA hydratase/isomerase family protein [Pelagibacterium sediminicola]|uniref:enoyl-CoA hydratase/isomerase family protein n=1 Tax=Pelagibacterium sediminicola TaxID=2248761 RepID=UPI000E31E96D|nr:enoyl-CoA hydratase/isomerase family protein [Pelagibacterium sediminicola]